MLNSAKRSRFTKKREVSPEQRRRSDRRVSTDDTRFPFIDDNQKLVMKDRRKTDRRSSDASLTKKPLQLVGKLLKK